MRRLRGLRWLLMLLMLAPGMANANHLTGYDWQLRALGGTQYRLTLTLYTDPIGELSPRDPSVTVGTFPQRPPAGGGGLMETFTLPLTSELTLPGSPCREREAPVRALTYAADIYFNTGRYSDPAGYYVAWERCCRNTSLTNVNAPNSVGMVAELKFPALPAAASAGLTIPLFRLPPPGAAWCVNALNTLDFGATAPTGTTLAYALVPAQAGFTSQNDAAQPAPNPGPYPVVPYAGSFNGARPIPGSFNFDTRTGELRGTPNQLGVYVVAVTVTASRGGQVVSVNRRELEVRVANCLPNERPTIARADGRLPTDTVRVTDAASRCLRLRIFDANPGQTLTLQATGAPVTLMPSGLTVPSPAAPQEVTVCWSSCIVPSRQTLRIWATDDACNAAASDTLRLPVVVAPLPNSPPRLLLPSGLPADTLSVQVGEILAFTLGATNPEDGAVSLSLLLDGAAPPPSLTVSPALVGEAVQAEVRWLPDCADARPAPHTLMLLADDGGCGTSHDSVRILVWVRGSSSAPLTLPNIITPNGDQFNDCLRLPDELRRPSTGCGGEFTEIEVFNRWGRSVFRSTESGFCWDGREVGAGTFFYVLTFGTTRVRGLLTVVE